MDEIIIMVFHRFLRSFYRLHKVAQSSVHDNNRVDSIMEVLACLPNTNVGIFASTMGIFRVLGRFAGSQNSEQ
jgi:hypothetical protein